MELNYLIPVMQFSAYVAAAAIFVVMIKADVRVINVKIEGLTNSIAALNTVLTRVAVQDQRISRIEDDISEMKHGRGFISLNGEYDTKGKLHQKLT